MRPIVEPAQMRELDRRTIDDVGIPGIVLMELAARGVMLEIEQLLGGNVAGAHALVFCGPGNNGGDGFAIARRLLNAGSEVSLYLCAPMDKITGDAKTNLDIYRKLDGAITVIENADQLARLPHAHIIVDALLGTGAEGPAHGIIADSIEAINKSGMQIVAVDIPSGINGRTGAAEGAAVRADVTATFGEIKVGHLIPPGLDHAGRISRVDIQIPPQFVHEMEIPLFFIEPGDVYEMMPQRPLTAHKGDFGKGLSIELAILESCTRQHPERVAAVKASGLEGPALGAAIRLEGRAVTPARIAVACAELNLTTNDEGLARMTQAYEVQLAAVRGFGGREEQMRRLRLLLTALGLQV